MNSEISEIIKDLSEAFLAIVSAVCVLAKTFHKNKKNSKRSKKEKIRNGAKAPNLMNYNNTFICKNKYEGN